MTPEERKDAIKEIRAICYDLGCTGVSKRCHTHPHECSIIQKLMAYVADPAPPEEE